jgi:hypothetical protein
MRQADIEAYRSAPGVGSPAVGGFHDSPAAARTHDIAMSVGWQVFGPLGEQTSQFPRLDVIASERAIGRQPRRSEKHDRVVNVGTTKTVQRSQVFRQNAHRSPVVTGKEGFVFIGELGGFWRAVGLHEVYVKRSKSMKPRATSVRTSLTWTWSPTSRPSNPLISLPSAVGAGIRTQVPLSEAPVTMASKR